MKIPAQACTGEPVGGQGKADRCAAARLLAAIQVPVVTLGGDLDGLADRHFDKAVRAWGGGSTVDAGNRQTGAGIDNSQLAEVFAQTVLCTEENYPLASPSCFDGRAWQPLSKIVRANT